MDGPSIKEHLAESTGSGGASITSQRKTIILTLATYVTQPVTRVFGWCLHCVFRVDGTPNSSSDGALISSCSGAEIAPLCELGRWGGCGASLFLRCLNVPVVVEFVPVIDVPPLPSAVVSGSFSRISSFSCCMFVFCGNEGRERVTERSHLSDCKKLSPPSPFRAAGHICQPVCRGDQSCAAFLIFIY